MSKSRQSVNLERTRVEHNYIRRVANALAKAKTRNQMAQIIMDTSCRALKTNAACLFLLQSDQYYEMIASKGCTARFRKEWKRIPKESLPLVNKKNPHETIFFGSSDAFKSEVPSSQELVDHSARKTIAYTPLVVNNLPIGVFGFSYNYEKNHFEQKEFILTLANLFAQALDRMRLFEKERIARKEAEQANRAKTEFLANISHEIRTPVGVIQGFADLLFKSQGLTEKQRRWASIVRKNSLHLSSLIGDVLDISKIEAEKIPISPRVFSISELIDDIDSITSSKAQEQGIELIFNPPKTNFEILSDPLHIRQIVVNLINNAIKFTPQGEIKVEVCYKDNSLLATVKDSGIGIAKENYSRIFEPFIQVDSSTSRRFGGAGLGLAISKRLANTLGGDLILVDSKLGKGSTFLLKIPCEYSGEVKSDSNHDNESIHAKLSGLDILLIDDSPDNRDLVSYLLMEHEAQVDVASNGAEGVRMALEKAYSVILMDIQMPKLDGFQAVTMLRSNGYEGPIAALTARALRTDKEESEKKGFNDYLTKPINCSMLIQTVERLSRLH